MRESKEEAAGEPSKAPLVAGASEAADATPILLVPYMWIGDFVRCHSVVRLIKSRTPDRPVDVLSSKLCAPLLDYMPGVRKGIVWDLPRKQLALGEHRALADSLVNLLMGATGAGFDIPEVHRWTVRDGSAVAAHFAIDTAAMLAAVEGEGHPQNMRNEMGAMVLRRVVKFIPADGVDVLADRGFECRAQSHDMSPDSARREAYPIEPHCPPGALARHRRPLHERDRPPDAGNMSIATDYSADERLAVYGSLRPGEENAHILAPLAGQWTSGTVRGRLRNAGWPVRVNASIRANLPKGRDAKSPV